MQPDDAADLLGEMDPALRVKLLGEMEPEEAAPVRRLLLYDENTAGGLMNPEPVVLRPDSTVAVALARDPRLVGARRARRPGVRRRGRRSRPRPGPTAASSGSNGSCGSRPAPTSPTASTTTRRSRSPPTCPRPSVAERLAAYNLMALPVCDDAGRLLGAVTVDDVLDRALPDNWREEHT